MSELQLVEPTAIKLDIPARKKKRKKVPQKSRSLKRGRILRRKSASFQPFAHEHIRYAWAAYRRGVFAEVEDLDQEMDATEFSAWFVEMILQNSDEAITLIGKTPEHGEIPLGLMLIEYKGNIAYPHAAWFPEASHRNILEITLAFLLELKKNHNIQIMSEKKNDRFFRHLCDYGVIRRVGLLRDWYAEKDHAILYQNVGH